MDKIEIDQVLRDLDIQYEKEIRKETGHSPANPTNDRARLFRLIPKYLELKRENTRLQEELDSSRKKHKEDVGQMSKLKVLAEDDLLNSSPEEDPDEFPIL